MLRLTIANRAVSVYDLAWERWGRPDPALYPQASGDANLSIPYRVASTMLNGRLRASSYLPDRPRDAAHARLIERAVVLPDPELRDRQRQATGSQPPHVEIELEPGQVAVSEIDRIPNDVAAPITDPDVEQKFGDNAEGILSVRSVDSVIGSAWNLTAGSGPPQLTEPFERVGSPTSRVPTEISGNDAKSQREPSMKWRRQ